MAISTRARIHTAISPKPATSVTQAEEELLASIMVSVSASLGAMSDEEREKAVAGAEKAVAHLQ